MSGSITVLPGEEFRILLPMPADMDLLDAENLVWGIMDEITHAEFIHAETVTPAQIAERMKESMGVDELPEGLTPPPDLNAWEMVFQALSPGVETFVCSLYDPRETIWSPKHEMGVQFRVIEIPEQPEIKVIKIGIPNPVKLIGLIALAWRAFRK